MEVDVQSLFGLHMCTAVLLGRDPATPPPIPPHLGSCTKALLVSQDRRNLFMTPWLSPLRIQPREAVVTSSQWSSISQSCFLPFILLLAGEGFPLWTLQELSQLVQEYVGFQIIRLKIGKADVELTLPKGELTLPKGELLSLPKGELTSPKRWANFTQRWANFTQRWANVTHKVRYNSARRCGNSIQRWEKSTHRGSNFTLKVS